MGAVEVVEVLPFAKPLVEDLGVDDHSLEAAVELLGVDPVRALNLPVEPRSGWRDVDVANASIKQMPVKARLELRAIVGLDRIDRERQPRQQVVDEGDRGLLVVLG